MTRSYRFFLLALFLTLNVFSARATQTTNNGMHAVPAPGPVTIDGKLDDWDLSGQVFMCYDIETLKDVYSAKVATMYDADNLYISIHWADQNPMCNIHDPHYQGNKGWAGDCVEFRIKTDEIANVDCWYYAANKEPTISITYGKDLTTPGGGPTKKLFQSDGWKLSDGAEEAFVKDADGQGYVQEIKLPWALITQSKRYAAGDTFAMGVELLWGAADWPTHRYADNMAVGYTSREFFFTNIPAWGPLTLEPKGNLTLPEPAYVAEMKAKTESVQGSVDITYDLPEDAQVTLAIDDASGQRVRNLIAAVPRAKGKVTEHWDGLTDYGKPVPAGEYTFTGLTSQGLHTKYTMSFANPGNPSWDTADGRGAFYADHSSAVAVASAGDYVALGCPIGEAGKPLIVCDLTGQRLWGQANRYFVIGGKMSLATDGTTLWVSQDQTGTIYRVELATGRYSPWDKTSRDETGKDIKVLDLQVFDPGKRTLAQSMETPNLTAISVNDHLLAVCFKTDGVVKLLDKNTGDVKSEVKVPEPVACVFDQSDGLVVLSQGQLVRIAADGTVAPFNAGTFPDGYGLAIDASRNIYLSVRGTDQDVQVFSPDGKLLRTIGKPGGRPLAGRFDADAMRNPGQLAIDRMGHLWVPEETRNPKRTSVWDATSGKLVKDLVGSTTYAGAGGINPFDPTMAFSDDTVYQIDLDKGTYHPTWSLGQPSGPDDIFPAHVFGGTNRVIQHGGATYVYTAGSSGSGAFVSCAVDKDDQWRSAFVIGVVPKKGPRGMDDLSSNPLFAGHDTQLFSWIDRNGDGLVQADELTFADRPMGDGQPVSIHGNYWGQLPDDQGTIVYGDPAGKNLVKFRVKDYLANGTPVYDINSPEIVPLSVPLNYGEGMVQGGQDGRTYVNQDPLTAFDKNGRQIFTYPNPYISVHGSHNALSARPGMLIGPSSFYGVVDMGGDTGEVFFLNGNLGQNFLFTWDGLFIQSLFKDCRGGFKAPDQAVKGESFDDDTGGGESFGGNFIRTPDGKTYLTNGGTDARVLEVTGLDQIKRFSGKFTYTPQQFALTQEQVPQTAAVASAADVAAATSNNYTIPKTDAPIAVDGKLYNWPELEDDRKPLIEIQESADVRFGRVAARYDDTNLYLAYKVISSDHELRNSGQDVRQLFKTGDVVDLMLGPDAQTSTEAGDLRLLFSELAGKPVAVLYEKSVPGTAEKDRVPFSSPWRTITFDRVTQPNEIKVAVSPLAGQGYLVETAIPWAKLGVTPSSGLKLKGDFGILAGDTGGTVTVSRKYWSNKATGLVNDVPGEADLEPARWGSLTLQ